jgi:predicted DNA-binding transcriptional regulator AlpA
MPDTLPLRAGTADPIATDPLGAVGERPSPGRREPQAQPVEPLLVDTDQAAALCGVSPASWYRLKAAGKTPAPVRLGGKVLYRVEDLRLWVALGCPDRKEFEVRKAACGRR